MVRRARRHSATGARRLARCWTDLRREGRLLSCCPEVFVNEVVESVFRELCESELRAIVEAKSPKACLAAQDRAAELGRASYNSFCHFFVGHPETAIRYAGLEVAGLIESVHSHEPARIAAHQGGGCSLPSQAQVELSLAEARRRNASLRFAKTP